MVGNDNERRLNECRNSARHRQAIKSACIYFLDQIEAGVDTKRALDNAAVKHCVKPENISMLSGVIRRKRLRIQKIDQDRNIMLLYRAGYQVKDNAGKVGLTRRTIHRVIAEFKHL